MQLKSDSLGEGPGTSAPRVMGAPGGDVTGKTYNRSASARADTEDSTSGAPLTMNDVAEAMLADDSIGAVQFGASFLVLLRGTGTGTAIRPALNEVAHRPADIWSCRANLFLGVPVVVEHPESGLLSSATFSETCVGTVIAAEWNAEAEEVRCVARIIDANAAALIRSGDTSDSSPSVLYAPEGEGETIEIDGVRVLIEAAPISVDHLAILFASGDGAHRGVWSRDGAGILNETSGEEYA